MKIATLGLTLLALDLGGCGKVDKKDISTSHPSSNVVSTEPSTGVAQGRFNKDAKADQRLVGSPNSEVKEDFVTFAPGALAVDTDVTIRQGSDLGSTPPADLGLASGVTILGGTTPVLLGASPDTPKTVAPFTISIPVPLDTPAGAKLNLADSGAKVGLLYLVKTDAGNKIGFYAFGTSDLVGTYLRYKTSSFGWFRIVILSAAAVTTEKTTQLSPGAK